MIIKNIFFSSQRRFFFVALLAGIVISIPLYVKSGISQDCNQASKTMLVGQNKELPLRGCAVRTYRKFLVVKVSICTVSLYTNTQHTFNDLFSGNYPWVIRIQYMRDIGEGKYQEGWKERFVTDLKIKEEKTHELLQYLPKAVNINDVLVLNWLPEEGLKILCKDKDMGLVKDTDLSMAVCKSFIGNVPPEGMSKEEWMLFTEKLLGDFN